jgi:hypothetical protein
METVSVEPPPAVADEPAAEPAAPIVAVQDDRPMAIELVKNFPIDGDRGTVGRWLEFSFTASPGFSEKWDAGAVEGSVYLVQYTVQGSGKGMHPAVNYLFEADLERQLVRGKNPAARQLLSGMQAPVKFEEKPAAKTRRRASSRKVPVQKPAPVPSGPKQLPLLPLPSDDDLQPPSGDGSSFGSDTVSPGL